jgi:CheY-like chemotaxis protein
LSRTTHTILVVEDEQMLRDSLVEFLEENGYEAIGANDGQDALAKLKTRGTPPCVILLDLMMPVLDGKAFREQQLRDPELARIPVIVLSAYRDVAGRAQDLMVADFFAKPLKLPALLDVVRQHCPLDN